MKSVLQSNLPACLIVQTSQVTSSMSKLTLGCQTKFLTFDLVGGRGESDKALKLLLVTVTLSFPHLLET